MPDVTPDRQDVVNRLTALLLYWHRQGGGAPTNHDIRADAEAFVRNNLTASAPAPIPVDMTLDNGKTRITGTMTAAPAGTPDASPHDWPEDFSHENGRYQNQCFECGTMFYGHKRRLHCRKCAPPAVEARETGEDTRRYRYALVRIMAHTGRAGIDGHTRDLALANGLLDSIARIAREALPAASRSPETGDKP